MNLFGGPSQGGSQYDTGGNVNIQGGFARRGVGGSIDVKSGMSESGKSGSISVASLVSGDQGDSGDITLR